MINAYLSIKFKIYAATSSIIFFLSYELLKEQNIKKNQTKKIKRASEEKIK